MLPFKKYVCCLSQWRDVKYPLIEEIYRQAKETSYRGSVPLYSVICLSRQEIGCGTRRLFVGPQKNTLLCPAAGYQLALILPVPKTKVASLTRGNNAFFAFSIYGLTNLFWHEIYCLKLTPF